ncbi:unnamed protein product [Caenorhabditis nigoni]
MLSCLICGSPEAETHFGGISCRACAAFFRRYCHSKKPIGVCTCKFNGEGGHPCRECRIQKCLAAGLTPGKVQKKRGKHSLDENDQNLRESTSASSANSLSPLQLSLTHTHLPFKDTKNITFTVPNFSIYEAKRFEVFSTLGSHNAYYTTSLTHVDISLVCNLVMDVFPDFDILSVIDKKCLINSFVTKIRLLEAVLDDVHNVVKYKKMEEKDVKRVLCSFLNGSFEEGEEMAEEDIWRTFGPLWTYFYRFVVEPIVRLSLDQMELMAIVWILFFDHAYNDISSKSTDLCWNIRKVIHRELRNYLIEKFSGDVELAENRFLNLLEIPIIVERGEQKFQEEVVLFELNRVKVHEDFIEIMKKQRI